MTLQKQKSYLSFELIGKTDKTLIYSILSGNTQLGLVKWYAPWRKYCFYTKDNCIFDINCLTEINDFIKALTNDRDAKKVSSRVGN